MTIGGTVTVSGCFTKEKFIAGRTLREIEKILGFHSGRLAQGMTVIALEQLPAQNQFDLVGYSNVATHRHQAPGGLDLEKLKAEARASWRTSGFERVVKVLSAIPHDRDMAPDVQYPPGQGAPQWISRVPLMGKVVGVVNQYPDGRYVAAGAAGRP